MRKFLIDEVRPGMVLARAVFNAQGDPLLRVGVTLTADHIKLLAHRGFAVVFARDSPDEEDVAEDIVSERVRQQAFRSLHAVYEIGALTLKQGAAGPGRTRDAKRQRANEAITDARVFDGIFQSVSELIHDVTSAPLILNLNTLRTHDTYTFYHCIDMTIVAIALGRKLNLNLHMLQQLALGCMVHDIGKLFIPLEILNKPGKLEPHEWEIMRQHPLTGYELLQRTGLNAFDLLPKHVALQHHERQDGTGYPRGLTGTNEVHMNSQTPPGQILPIAEIAAVADVYDALRADRPYRPALAPEKIVAIMQESAGSHLNRTMVEVLFSVMPLYPAGAPVVMTSPGPYQGYHGVVITTRPEALMRPVIRLLEDDEGRPLTPVRLDLNDDPTLEIASSAAYASRR